MDFSEKWGRDVDEAVQLALNDLKVPLEEVKVTVLEEPSKGFFGLGSKLALVRVEKITAAKAEEKKAPVDGSGYGAGAAARPERPVRADRPERQEQTERPERQERPERPARQERSGERRDRRERPERPERPERSERPQRTYGDAEEGDALEAVARIREKPENLEETTDTPALAFLQDMTEKMDLDLNIKAYKNDEYLYIDINGKDSGTIIGTRGQTLDAVQYLTSLVVNKENEKYVRVIVDAENYREKRERTLEQLAKRLADKVKRSGKSVRLEPMNPYERKVIHATLQRYPGVTTRSEGEEPYRRVVIERK